MSDIYLICNYCNHSWKFYPSYYEKVEDAKCPKCKSGDLKAKKISEDSKDVYGYNKK